MGWPGSQNLRLGEMASSLQIDPQLGSTVCCCLFRGLDTIAELELRQNGTHFGNGARSRSFPEEPSTSGRTQRAPSISARVGSGRVGAARNKE